MPVNTDSTGRHTATRSLKITKNPQVDLVSPNDLADHFGKALVISKAKGKRNAVLPNVEERRLAAMRSVNTASQNLSILVQLGWKPRTSEVPSSDRSSTMTSINACAKTISVSLRELRDICPKDLDVGQAALSVVGKFIALEMFDMALVGLSDMHEHLCSLYHSAPSITPPKKRKLAPSKKPCPHNALPILSLPLPPSELSANTILQSLISKYLLHAITSYSRCFLSIKSATTKDVATLDSFSKALLGSPTFLVWVPLLSALSSKQKDSLLTCAYTTLTTSISPATHSLAASIFRIRSYALSCLLHTSPGIVEPNTFWNQATKFGATYTNGNISNTPTTEVAAGASISVFSDLIRIAEKREDRKVFMTGTGFVGFCEHWMKLAKQDSSLLDRIVGLAQSASGPLIHSSIDNAFEGAGASEAGSSVGLKSTQTSMKEQEFWEEKVSAAAAEARICATFAQATALLEQFGSDLHSRNTDLIIHIREATLLLRNSASLIFPAGTLDADGTRRAGKLWKALERMRRAAVKAMDGVNQCSAKNREADCDCIMLLLVATADVLKGVLAVREDLDLLTEAMDTFFLLARTSLVPQDVRTHARAFDFLTRAVELLGLENNVQDASKPASGRGESQDSANLVRCASGAFYNLAGVLYQEGRHGPAVRFLKEGCKLGSRALDVYHHCEASVPKEEHWKALEGQLYRRWELLGVCYSKIGDRKFAFEAFTQAVKAFPYSEADFVTRAGLGGPSTVFNASTCLKQLGSIIDKLTYLATCEMFLDPVDVSLKSTMEMQIPAIMGMLLERQLESLSGSIGKEGVGQVVLALLKDAKEVYVEDEMPIRRARILLKCMDFAYHMGSECVVGPPYPQEIGEEAASLLTRVSFGHDSTLTQFCPQYRASAHLWLALHVHRRADAEQTTMVAHHVQEACNLLETLFANVPGVEITKGKKSIQKQKVVTRNRTERAPAVRGVSAGAKKIVRSITREPVTPKPRRDSLNVTPPKFAEHKKSLAIFDDFDKLLALLETMSSLLGLLGLILSKVSILDVMRRICERQEGTLGNGYLIASVEIARQYVKLGKIKRASTFYNQAFNRIRNTQVSEEVRIRLFLYHAEALAILDNVPRSSNIYCDALALSDKMVEEDKKMSTSQRVRARVTRLERAAIASHVFALIRYAKNDMTTSLDGMLQSLRLWNRAVDSLARLRPRPQSPNPADLNPFEMSDIKDALPSGTSHSIPVEKSAPKIVTPRRSMDNLEFRISEGLLDTLFALSEAYFSRGSAREAEYFAQQAQDFATSMNAPAMVGRALARKGEVQLHQGRLDDGYQSISQAMKVLRDVPSPDRADIQRLHGDYNQRRSQLKDARHQYAEATSMLEELNGHFLAFDGLTSRPRKSTSLTPTANSVTEVLVPTLLATVLHQHIWLLRDDAGEDSRVLLNRFLSLPPSSQMKADENALMAKLTLHDVYSRFRADIFLSSLAESPITLPMGMSGDKLVSLAPSTQDILTALENAEKMFWADLTFTAGRGKVVHIRNAALSLALIKALQTSLGKAEKEGTVLAVNLLNASTAITLRREMLENIQNKLFDFQTFDDLQWPLITPDGSLLPRPKNHTHARLDRFFGSGQDSGLDLDEKASRQYWETIQARYTSQVLDSENLSRSSADKLPANWTVVNISVTEDKSTMFVTRQRANTEPLIFCVPLKGRRESDEDEHLTFDDALNELRTIVGLSDEGTRQAVNVKGDDSQARAAWWAARNALDKRMQELLENVEFCWLGAFKTILSQPMNIPSEVIADLRTRFDNVFQRGLQSQEKRQKTRIRLDDTLLECFSTLSPKCRDEELEDLIYFILDLYQFHGVGVAIAEVDIDQVVVDLRTALEEHVGKTKDKIVPESDSHMFLVLDRNVQEIPWESIPILRGRSVSRIPSMEFLVDRLQYAKWRRERISGDGGDIGAAVDDRAAVDPRKSYYILNPSGDLRRTEERFVSWLKDMNQVGWEGVVGQPPSEQQFLDALSRKELVIYFGHGGGEQYVRSHKIRNLPRCAATMLWGCSSGALKEMGDFDRVGTPYNYMLAGCPTLVANIWDVTDRDIDKFAQSVFDRMNMTVGGVGRWQDQRGEVSLVTAVAQSRDSCKLKYLTGAAPVVYGIPFYL